MLTQFAEVTVSGALVGALGGAFTVLLCVICNRAAKLIIEYLWLVSESWTFSNADYPVGSAAKM
jgi:hypothetical protein